MTLISAIVAMSENRVIGRDNALPWHISADLKRFKALTLGKPVVMGRKTYESIGKPLPGRPNIIISRSGFQADGVKVYGSVFEALSEARILAGLQNLDEIMVIGGAQIYKETLPLLDRIHMTQVHQHVEGDAMFPVLAPREWIETFREDHAADDKNPAYSFITLTRNLD